MSGGIRAEGAYHGVSRLEDRHTGRQVIDPRYSALNLFRLFSVNQGMGMPRTMDRAVNDADNAIEIHWPATDMHLGEITARYEITEPHAVDLTITVRSRGSYPGYEIFLSNYFDKALKPQVYLRPRPRGGKAGKPQRVVPKFNEVFRDTVLVFPRDAAWTDVGIGARAEPLPCRWFPPATTAIASRFSPIRTTNWALS